MIHETHQKTEKNHWENYFLKVTCIDIFLAQRRAVRDFLSHIKVAKLLLNHQSAASGFAAATLAFSSTLEPMNWEPLAFLLVEQELLQENPEANLARRYRVHPFLHLPTVTSSLCSLHKSPTNNEGAQSSLPKEKKTKDNSFQWGSQAREKGRKTRLSTHGIKVNFSEPLSSLR